jgi:hypothetical protein
MSKSKFFRGSIFLCFVFVASHLSFALGDFKPIPADELALKGDPKAPGAHAIILLWTDDEDDTESREDHYFRIKILTEEGKKYADVEIPYFKNIAAVTDIKARTIHPDGTIYPFTGKPFDKTVVKSRGVKYLAKTFTLPDVQPGSIIEYRYRVGWDQNTLYSTHWSLQRDLFVKKAIFTLKPYTAGPYATVWLTLGLPANKTLVKKGTSYELQLEDLVAFEEERLSPPERELKPRIEFFYRTNDMEQGDKFWQKVGKENNSKVESFIGHRGEIARVANETVSASDDPETKLRKLYARAQKIRNLSFERDKTEQEDKRDKLKLANNVEDILKNGYGSHIGINRLFAGLARAAGIDATILKVSQRDDYFFMKGLLDERQLNSEIVHARVAGKDFYLDPGLPMCPFGLISWENTGVQAIELGKDGGTFVQTPQPSGKNGIMRRLAKLKYVDGGMKGTVSVSFEGQQALTRRLIAINNDETDQKKSLEDEVKRWLPAGSEVKLAKITNATDPEKPLVTDFDVELPAIASNVGSRILLPISVFQASNDNPFKHEKRVHPVYYDYPFQELDQVMIELPPDLKVESLPAAQKQAPEFAYYDAVWEQQGNVVVLKRRFTIPGILYRTDMYPGLRSFYEKVNTTDQESVVLRAQTVSAK